MTKYLQKQLQRLDYEEIVRNVLNADDMDLQPYPSIVWAHDSWTIEFLAIPKNEARGIPGIRPIGSIFRGAESVDSVSSIKRRIDSKYSHYGEPSIPYVLAINLVDYADDESVVDALLGDQVGWFSPATGKFTVAREQNGAWISPSGYQKKRMSALCVFRGLRPILIHKIQPVVWHHPYPNNPLNPNMLTLSQQIPNHAKGLYEFRTGKRSSELLHIDENQMPH